MGLVSSFGLVVVVFAVIIGFFLFLYYFPFGLWIRTIAAGVPLSMMSLIRMRLIGIQPGVITQGRSAADDRSDAIALSRGR